MASLDDILNVAIPIILILIAVGFVWLKLLGPWLGPWLSKMWERLNNTEINVHRKKEIVYE